MEELLSTNKLKSTKLLLVLTTLILILIITPVLKMVMSTIEISIYETVRDKTPDYFESAVKKCDDFSVVKIKRHYNYPLQISTTVTIDYKIHSHNSITQFIESFKTQVLPDMSEIELDKYAKIDFFDASNHSDDSDGYMLFSLLLNFSDKNNIKIQVCIYDNDINADDFEPIAENVTGIFCRAKYGKEPAPLSEEFLNKYPHLKNPIYIIEGNL